MAGPIATLRVMLAGDDSELRTALGRSDKASKKWAKSQKRQAEMAAKSMRSVALAVVGIGTSFAVMTKKAIEHADGLAKQSRTLGVTVEKLQEYTFAAERSGVSTEEMVKGLQNFNKFVGQAARGTGTAKIAFEQMGISLYDTAGGIRTSADLIDEFVDKMAGIESPAMRAGLAADVFGRAGVKLLPMMDQGAEGLAKLRKAAHDLGNVLDGTTAAKAEFLNDRLGELTTMIETKTTTALVNMAWSARNSFDDLVRATSLVFGVKIPEYFAKFRISLLNNVTKGFANAAIASIKGMQKLVNGIVNLRDHAPSWVSEFFGWTEGSADTGIGNAFIARLEKDIEVADAGITKLQAKLQTYKAIEDAMLESRNARTAGQAGALAGSITGGTGSGGVETTNDYDPANDPLIKGMEAYNKLQDETAELEKKVKQARMDNIQSGINLMGQFAKKGSALAKISIIAETAMNIARIAMNTEVAYAKSLTIDPTGALGATVRAQGKVSQVLAGAAGAAALGGQFHDGINNVPMTGTYLLEKGERVVDSRLNADLTKALDGGGMGGGSPQNITFSVQGVEDPDVINRVINENRGEFESMLRQINTDRAGAGLI